MARSLRRRHPLAAGLLLCLATLLVASPADGQSATPTTAELQGLIEDLGFQLRMVYRGRPKAFAERYEFLRGVLGNWNESSKTAADAAMMDRWLREAIRATMPGVKRSMPTAPEFAAPATMVVESLPRPASPESTPSPITTPSAVEPSPVVQAAPVTPPTEAAPAPIAAAATPDFDEPLAAETEGESPSMIDELFPEEPPVESLATEPAAPSEPAMVDDAADAFADDDEFVFEEPAAERPIGESSIAKSPVAEAPAAAHPAATQLVWGDPFADDPLPADEQQETTRLKPVVADVEINRMELAARLRGFRLKLRQIEAELMASPEASGFRLAGWARDLAKLEEQIAVAELYTEVVAQESGEEFKLPRTTPVRKLLASRISSRSAGVAVEGSRNSQAEQAVLREASGLLSAGGGS